MGHSDGNNVYNFFKKYIDFSKCQGLKYDTIIWDINMYVVWPRGK